MTVNGYLKRITAGMLLAGASCVFSLGAGAQQNTSVKFRHFVYEGRDSAVKDSISEGSYLNPVLSGFYPDPSVLRVGKEFYLVNSSFSYFPGVPIFHSTDLVHWKSLGHVLTTPTQLPILREGISRGIFAPTLRYHKGVFYMITTNVGPFGNFYVTAKDPRGPWSEPKKLPQIQGIDPSFFFDRDGKAYIVHNGKPLGEPKYDGHCAIWLFPFDLEKGEVSGPGRVLVDGGTDISKKPIWIEGPHLYFRNGWYYLMAAEGGTAENHSEVIFRSRSLDGPFVPWEKNPILTQRDLPEDRANPITSTGHADLVELENGEWWAVFLGCRPYETAKGKNYYNLGRETFLLPVEWKDDWPVILPPGKTVPRFGKAPNLPKSAAAPQTGNFTWKDDFDAEKLSSEWEIIRTPEEHWWKTGSGALELTPRNPLLGESGTPSALLRRQQHHDFSASVEVDLTTLADADAGLTAFQNDTHFYAVAVKANPAKPEEKQLVLLEANKGTAQQVGAPVALDMGAKMLELRVTMQGNKYLFFAKPKEAKSWTQIGPPLDATVLSTRSAGGFVGTMIGVFAEKRSF